MHLRQTGRFEATITVIVVDEDDILGDDLSDCDSCFLWQYTSDGETEWTTFDYDDSDDISVSITESGDEYSTILVVQSIRRSNAGNCVDDDDASDHPFEGGTDYRVRLKFVSDSDDYYVSEISNETNFSTNTLPSGGECSIQNIDDLSALDYFNLWCDGWDNAINMTYNGMMPVVLCLMATFGHALTQHYWTT